LVAGLRNLPVKNIVPEIQRREARMVSETTLAGSSKEAHSLENNCFAHNNDDDDP
jgi:hypothetical protein